MKYRVLAPFIDREDLNRLYEVGSTYPRNGLKPSAERVKALSTTGNASFSVLIEPIKEEGNKDE